MLNVKLLVHHVTSKVYKVNVEMPILYMWNLRQITFTTPRPSTKNFTFVAIKNSPKSCIKLSVGLRKVSTQHNFLAGKDD
jgi:hypothetical protein